MRAFIGALLGLAASAGASVLGAGAASSLIGGVASTLGSSLLGGGDEEDSRVSSRGTSTDVSGLLSRGSKSFMPGAVNSMGQYTPRDVGATGGARPSVQNAQPALKYDDKFGQEMTYWMRMMKSIATQSSK